MYKVEIITNNKRPRILTTESYLEALCLFWTARTRQLELSMRNHKHFFKISLIANDNGLIDKYEYEYKGEWNNDN